MTLAGGEVAEYALKAENDFYPDFDEMEKQDLSRVKLMFVNYPNMPTGTHPTVELFEKLSLSRASTTYCWYTTILTASCATTSSSASSRYPAHGTWPSR